MSYCVIIYPLDDMTDAPWIQVYGPFKTQEAALNKIPSIIIKDDDSIVTTEKIAECPECYDDDQEVTSIEEVTNWFLKKSDYGSWNLDFNRDARDCYRAIGIFEMTEST